MTEPRLIEMVKAKCGEMYPFDFDRLTQKQVIKATAQVIREWAIKNAVGLDMDGSIYRMDFDGANNDLVDLSNLLALLTTED